MTADEDPERRISDLERPLLQSAADSEWPSPPPRVGLRLGWIALGLMIVGLTVAGGAILAGRASGPVSDKPTMVGGGGTVAESPAAPTFSLRPTPTRAAPPVMPPVIPDAASTPAPGDTVSVAGVGNDRMITCTDNAVSISGVDNKVVLTGHCRQVEVSGVGNTVTIDAADAIGVSGMNNSVTFYSGTPELDNSGLNNALQQG